MIPVYFLLFLLFFSLAFLLRNQTRKLSYLFTGGLSLHTHCLAKLTSWLRGKAQQRQLEQQLLPFLDSLLSSLRAGNALHSSIEVCAQKQAEPLKTLLKEVLLHTQLGQSFATAFLAAAKKTPLCSVQLMGHIFVLSQDLGLELSTMLEHCATQIRQRINLRRKIHAITAQTRVQAYVCMTIPMVFLLAVHLMVPDYLEPLWSHRYGLWILTTCLLGMALGGLWMKGIAAAEFLR